MTPFMYLENVAEGMLKGLGEQRAALRYSLVNVAVRLVLIALLVPRAGMTGFLWMMLADNIITSLLHAGRVLTALRLRPDWGRWVVRPLLCAAAAGALGTLLRRQLTLWGWRQLWVVLGVGGVMALCYAALLFCLRSFTAADVRALLGVRTGRSGTKEK